MDASTYSEEMQLQLLSFTADQTHASTGERSYQPIQRGSVLLQPCMGDGGSCHCSEPLGVNDQ